MEEGMSATFCNRHTTTRRRGRPYPPGGEPETIRPPSVF